MDASPPGSTVFWSSASSLALSPASLALPQAPTIAAATASITTVCVLPARLIHKLRGSTGTRLPGPPKPPGSIGTCERATAIPRMAVRRGEASTERAQQLERYYPMRVRRDETTSRSQIRHRRLMTPHHRYSRTLVVLSGGSPGAAPVPGFERITPR